MSYIEASVFQLTKNKCMMGSEQKVYVYMTKDEDGWWTRQTKALALAEDLSLVAPAPADSTPSSGLCRHLNSHAHTHTQAHMHVVKNKINFERKKNKQKRYARAD